MAWLRKHRNAWQKPASLVGVRWNLDEQLEWLGKICRGYYAEVQGQSLYRQALASGVGLGYGPIESQVLHCFIRSAGPRTIIEIGGGVTTALMAEYVQRSSGQHLAAAIYAGSFLVMALAFFSMQRYLLYGPGNLAADRIDERLRRRIA